MVTRWTMGVVCVLALGLAAQAQAAYSDSFNALRVELVSRAAVLSSSDDKVEIKQSKVCLKAIAAIDKSSTLANDVKTAGKVTKSLAKAFPSEFGVSTLASITFSNNLHVLVTGVFNNLANDVHSGLDDLQTAINGMPAGTARNSAQSVHDAAEDLLDSGSSSDLLSFVKSLTTALKDVTKGTKIVNNGSGGGGGGGGGVGNATLKCSIDGKSFTAFGAGGTYVSITGEIDVLGATAQKGVNVTTFNVTSTGTYPAEAGCYVVDLSSGITYGNNVTGTVTITTFDTVHKKAIGTFSFSADQSTPPGSGHVDVTAGQFNVDLLP
jgi:hypothetical protein